MKVLETKLTHEQYLRLKIELLTVLAYRRYLERQVAKAVIK